MMISYVHGNFPPRKWERELKFLVPLLDGSPHCGMESDPALSHLVASRAKYKEQSWFSKERRHFSSAPVDFLAVVRCQLVKG